MWLAMGITLLLSRAVVSNFADDGDYYSTDTRNGGSSNGIDKPGYEKTEMKNSERTNLNESDEDRNEYRAIEDNTIGDRGGKRSITNTDIRDMPSGQRQVPAPLATLLYWPEREDDQVIEMEQRRNPLMQERRNPAFSPWGGKRDVQPRYQTITKIRRPVRVPFNSWGGKRNGDSSHRTHYADVKREKFFNWGGKKRSYGWAIKNETARIIDDLYPSANYRYHSLQRKSSTMNIGQRTSNDLGSAEDGDKINSGQDGLTGGGSSPRAHFAPWDGKKRRFSGCNTEDSRSASLSLILCKIEQMLPSNG